MRIFAYGPCVHCDCRLSMCKLRLPLKHGYIDITKKYAMHIFALWMNYAHIEKNHVHIDTANEQFSHLYYRWTILVFVLDKPCLYLYCRLTVFAFVLLMNHAQTDKTRTNLIEHEWIKVPYQVNMHLVKIQIKNNGSYWYCKWTILVFILQIKLAHIDTAGEPCSYWYCRPAMLVLIL